jgi:hypothetical protein
MCSRWDLFHALLFISLGAFLMSVVLLSSGTHLNLLANVCRIPMLLHETLVPVCSLMDAP